MDVSYRLNIGRYIVGLGKNNIYKQFSNYCGRTYYRSKSTAIFSKMLIDLTKTPFNSTLLTLNKMTAH